MGILVRVFELGEQVDRGEWKLRGHEVEFDDEGKLNRGRTLVKRDGWFGMSEAEFGGGAVNVVIAASPESGGE